MKSPSFFPIHFVSPPCHHSPSHLIFLSHSPSSHPLRCIPHVPPSSLTPISLIPLCHHPIFPIALCPFSRCLTPLSHFHLLCRLHAMHYKHEPVNRGQIYQHRLVSRQIYSDHKHTPMRDSTGHSECRRHFPLDNLHTRTCDNTWWILYTAYGHCILGSSTQVKPPERERVIALRIWGQGVLRGEDYQDFFVVLERVLVSSK